jgi:hypothetical protein
LASASGIRDDAATFLLRMLAMWRDWRAPAP